MGDKYKMSEPWEKLKKLRQAIGKKCDWSEEKNCSSLLEQVKWVSQDRDFYILWKIHKYIKSVFSKTHLKTLDKETAKTIILHSWSFAFGGNCSLYDFIRSSVDYPKRQRIIINLSNVEYIYKKQEYRCVLFL